MSCAPEAPTFRLLDAYVGWDSGEVSGLTGLTDPAGLRLAHLGSNQDAPDRQALLPWFPDRRLAPGHGRCSWFLLAPQGLLRRDLCGGGWTPVWAPGCAPTPPLVTPVAVAAAGHWLAVAETQALRRCLRAGHQTLRVWWREGEQLIAVLPVEAPRVVALTASGEAFVATVDNTDLWQFKAGGASRGVLHTGLPGRVEGLRIDCDGHLWLLTEDENGLHIWRSKRDHLRWRAATLAELAEALPPSTLVATWDGGFCLRETSQDGEEVDACYTWDGVAVADRPPAAPTLVAQGELLTVAVDSGVPRCRWHRIRLDADVPAGTAVRVAIAVTEEAGAPTELPEQSDWQEAPPGALDFLVDQPPGRRLFLRLRLSGDGTLTPVVRRIRLDFPRVTSADLLPAAFREDPAADDFTERFLSLFDSSLAQIDRVIERYPALLDARGVPDEALPWLGGLLGLAFEAGWDAGTRRALLAAAPELYRRRGTPSALQEVVRIVFGVQPVIEELAAQRSWVTLGSGQAPAAPVPAGFSGRGRLGIGRLFGQSAARFRIGSSALSTAPLHSFGDPYTDPLSAHAYRFRVSMPPRTLSPADEPALRRLVQSQAPAHTAASIHSGGLGWVVGVWSAVGIDTAFVPLPAPVLGPVAVPRLGRPVRLGRSSVLAASRRGPHRGMAVGERTAVGVQSVSW
jgi:phage tail-like protein